MSTRVSESLLERIAPLGVATAGFGKPDLKLRDHIVMAHWPKGSACINPYSLATAVGWHGVTSLARWDVDRITRDFQQFLRSSNRNLTSGNVKWEDTAFILEESLMFTLSDDQAGYRELQLWADSLEAAERELNRLKSSYLLPEKPRPDVDEFFLVTCGDGELRPRRVEIEPLMCEDQDLCLHYGEEFCCWHAEFLRKLNTHKLGLTILQGPPGVGKTSYLRYLLRMLRRSHRFYYLPVTVYPVLASPGSAKFWVSETALHGRRQKVVFIEDAEMLLMERAPDNQASLSNLLNIADGFLGAFLRVHVICTVNTQIEKLDPAVLRPGRLLARYTFPRLSPEQANALATAKGLRIRHQDSYSLAEIYNQNEDQAAHAPAPIGFCK
jgi:hypothetical protein